MARVYNFSSGPAVLAEEVLRQAAAEMLEYRDFGVSVMEMSHRSRMFEEIVEDAEATLRRLIEIPEDYQVLFLQGGASLQFAMIPLNFLSETGSADYVNTGLWSKRAIAEAKRYGNVRVVADSEAQNFTYVPELPAQLFDPASDYVHITTNNTIYGTRFHRLPEVGSVPLIADMSSHFLGEEVDISKFAMVYAGAQKNLGPAGMTLVILRKEMMGKARAFTPTMLDYLTHAKEGSLYNTPPCYAIYISGLVFRWMERNGGVAAMAERNREKAQLFYDYLDESRLFKARVQAPHRSLMNIPFVTGNETLDKCFVAEAEKVGLINLKGHRSVGGMRASLYNAMPREGVVALIDFMASFEKKYNS